MFNMFSKEKRSMNYFKVIVYLFMKIENIFYPMCNVSINNRCDDPKFNKKKNVFFRDLFVNYANRIKIKFY